MSINHEYYMSIVLNEAKKGLGFTSPNPLVGAVIVKNSKILSTGYHKRLGFDHAEIDAIKKVSKNELIGSTLYVNLEPCCHYGKTPPCADTIIKSGIKKVVIANKDTDKRVNGKSIKLLKKSGIQIITGVLEKEAKQLNSLYFFYKTYNRPYVVLKSALSIDGKIATKIGDSKWISSDNCRKIVHKLRLKMKSIAIGKNTVIKDKPKLNCRIKGFEDKPVDKLIFSNERINTNSFAKNTGNILFVDNTISKSTKMFIDYCNKNEIDSILVEGGGKLYSWFLENNLVDRIFLFYKPGFIGNDGIPFYINKSKKYIKDIDDYKLIKTEIIDNNYLVELSNGDPICLLD